MKVRCTKRRRNHRYCQVTFGAVSVTPERGLPFGNRARNRQPVRYACREEKGASIIGRFIDLLYKERAT
jgi:hypothetical protein